MASKNYTQEQFIEAVKNSYSYSGVCRILGISPKGGNLKTVKNKIQQLELNASHFTGQRWNRGKTSESHSSIKKKIFQKYQQKILDGVQELSDSG